MTNAIAKVQDITEFDFIEIGNVVGCVCDVNQLEDGSCEVFIQEDPDEELVTFYRLRDGEFKFSNIFGGDEGEED